MSAIEEIEEDLSLDMRAYGTCYWKFVDGVKTRVHPRDVRYIDGVPRDSQNHILSSASYSVRVAEDKTGGKP